MDEEQKDKTRRDSWALIEKVRTSEDSKELREICRNLTPLLIAYWDIHPHSAMESLECVARDLPLPLAHSVVRQVVTAWRQKATYDPNAGGSADHCYLSALILSENYDLAEHPWADSLLESTLRKDLSNGYRQMKDKDQKIKLVRNLMECLLR